MIGFPDRRRIGLVNFPAMAGSEVKKQQRHVVRTMPAKKEQRYYEKFDKNESNRRERSGGRRKQNHRQIWRFPRMEIIWSAATTRESFACGMRLPFRKYRETKED